MFEEMRRQKRKCKWWVLNNVMREIDGGVRVRFRAVLTEETTNKLVRGRRKPYKLLTRTRLLKSS